MRQVIAGRQLLKQWYYIGDGRTDLEFARNAGAVFLAVTTGVTTKEQFLAMGQPDEFIQHRARIPCGLCRRDEGLSSFLPQGLIPCGQGAGFIFSSIAEAVEFLLQKYTKCYKKCSNSTTPESTHSPPCFIQPAYFA